MRWYHLSENQGLVLSSESEKIEAFNTLADEQRGAPEILMVQAQHILGGGVLSYCIEHVGDITNRMAHYPDKIRFSGYEMVEPKVRKSLALLDGPYGFEREVAENMRNNAKYRDQDLKELEHKSHQALKRYGDAHASLRVYNSAQRTARDAAVALGYLRFDEARRLLRVLSDNLTTPEVWHSYASAYPQQIDEGLSERADFFHVTLGSNIESILKHGLRPSIGPRSTTFGEASERTYLFRSVEDAEAAASSWLGDQFEEDEGEFALLRVRVPPEIRVITDKDDPDTVGMYEAVVHDHIPPQYISVEEEIF